jgi:hypothetical protein
MTVEAGQPHSLPVTGILGCGHAEKEGLRTR